MYKMCISKKKNQVFVYTPKTLSEETQSFLGVSSSMLFTSSNNAIVAIIELTR